VWEWKLRGFGPRFVGGKGLKDARARALPAGTNCRCGRCGDMVRTGVHCSLASSGRRPGGRVRPRGPQAAHSGRYVSQLPGPPWGLRVRVAAGLTLRWRPRRSTEDDPTERDGEECRSAGDVDGRIRISGPGVTDSEGVNAPDRIGGWKLTDGAGVPLDRRPRELRFTLRLRGREDPPSSGDWGVRGAVSLTGEGAGGGSAGSWGGREWWAGNTSTVLELYGTCWWWWVCWW